MSDILEALRKVELQRSNAKVPGISTRQRYYTAQGRRLGAWPLLLVAAAFVGASLSGAAAVYLVHADEVEQPAPPPPAAAAAVPAPSRPPAVPLPPAPLAVKEAGREAPRVRPGSVQPQPQRASLQATHAAPPRLPGPRQQAAAQPAHDEKISETDAASESSPVQEDLEPAPADQTQPEKPQPAAPGAAQETEVASDDGPPLEEEPATPAPAAPTPPERTAYSRVPNSAETLSKIRPPMAVEVKPYRPNDVLRPPVSRKKPAATGGVEPPLLSTLSSQFQSMVPKLAINAQVYSATPQQRFVVINMKRYNEGQNTAEGVTVESIRQDDIIFAYQGQRFRLGR